MSMSKYASKADYEKAQSGDKSGEERKLCPHCGDPVKFEDTALILKDERRVHIECAGDFLKDVYDGVAS